MFVRIFRTGLWTAVAAALLILPSCADQPETPLEPDSNASSELAGPAFEVAPGVAVTREQAERTLADLGRKVAVALGQDRDLRQYIRSSMDNSPYREGKLDFRAELNDVSSGLLAGLASGSAEEPSAITASVDSLMPLELYMPVDAHRQDWEGSSDLIVATLMGDDPGDEIFGYDLSGQSVELSMEEPPNQPTLVLVPAETDFNAPLQIQRGSLVGPALTRPLVSVFHRIRGMIASSPFGPAPTAYGGYGGGDGIYMTTLSIDDLREPWGMGDPEIAVHVGIYNDNSGALEWKSCAGDGFSSSSPYYFDMNDNYWGLGSSVKIASENTVKGESVEYYVWEDDHDRCDGTNHLEPHTNASLTDNLEDVGTALYNVITLDSLGINWETLQALGGLAKAAVDYATAINEDDFVGIVKEISTDCYIEESGPVWHALVDQNGNNTGDYIKLDNTNDVDRDMCDPGSFDPVSASISGPTEIPTTAAEGCGYTAITSGGAGDNSYEWRWDGTDLGWPDQSTWAPQGGLSEGWHELTVDVFNEYTGTSDQGSLWIDVDDAYSCF